MCGTLSGQARDEFMTCSGFLSASICAPLFSAFRRRDFFASAPGLRETDCDSLFAALHLHAVVTAAQRPFLACAHHSRNHFCRTARISRCHGHSPSTRSVTDTVSRMSVIRGGRPLGAQCRAIGQNSTPHVDGPEAQSRGGDKRTTSGSSRAAIAVIGWHFGCVRVLKNRRSSDVGLR